MNHNYMYTHFDRDTLIKLNPFYKHLSIYGKEQTFGVNYRQL